MIRDAGEADLGAVLALNLAFERFLSPLDAPRLAALHARAWSHRVLEDDGAVAGFLLAFAPGADYDSPNYRWFDARDDGFVYVDRVVVGALHQGRRFAEVLYRDLFGRALGAGFEAVVCEFDLDPPNEPSRRFHARLGFEEIGSQYVASSGKRVSLQRVVLGKS